MEDKSLHNAHDKRYKTLLGSKKAFLELLQSCIHEEWVQELSEESLVKIDKSYILQDFEEKESDMVYEASIKDHKVVFYILVEMQSTVDYLMPYRLLNYIIEIWRDYVKNLPKNETRQQSFKLPAVIPLVIYNGTATWTASRRFRDMIDGYNNFREHIVDFEHILIDVQRYTDKDLKAFSKLIGVVFSLEQSVDNVSLLNRLKQWIQVVKTFSEDEYKLLIPWLKILTYDMPKVQKESIEDILESAKPWEVDNVICFAEEGIRKERQEIFEKGKQEGIEKGKIEGRLEGRLEGELEGRLEGKLEGERKKAIEFAQKMLAKGYETAEIMELTGLSEEEINSLKQ